VPPRDISARAHSSHREGARYRRVIREIGAGRTAACPDTIGAMEVPPPTEQKTQKRESQMKPLLIALAALAGWGAISRAATDRYMLCHSRRPPRVLTPAIFTLPYDRLNRLEPVALLAPQPLLIIARQAMPANRLAEFLARLKANPGKATQSTAGAGEAT